LGRKPFSGLTIRPEEFLSLSDLRATLGVILNDLRPLFNDFRLFMLEDRPEHDGYLTEARAVPREELEGILTSDETLRQACSEDNQVYLGVYPETMDFYLRFGVYEEDGGRLGDFNVSASAPNLNRLISELNLFSSIVLVKEVTKEFFNRIYAG
jgi:hypothetical protein